jgi:hypothetical protein
MGRAHFENVTNETKRSRCPVGRLLSGFREGFIGSPIGVRGILAKTATGRRTRGDFRGLISVFIGLAGGPAERVRASAANRSYPRYSTAAAGGLPMNWRWAFVFMEGREGVEA